MRNCLRMIKKGCVAAFWASAFLAFLTIINDSLGLPTANYSMLKLGIIMPTSLILFAMTYVLIQNLYPEEKNPSKVPPKLKIIIFSEVVFTGLTFIGTIATPFVMVLLARKFPKHYFEAGLYVLIAIGVLAGTFRMWRRAESKRIGICLPLDECQHKNRS